MKFASAVPTKGSSGKFAVDRALEFIAEVGDIDGQIIIKNDQGPSIKYFKKIKWRAGILGCPSWRNRQLKAVGVVGW